MLLLITGPPAVGKMTVGQALVDRSSFRLFHNHHTIELLLDVFDFGTPGFVTLNSEFRRRVIEEAAASGTDLIFTFVWDLDLEEDSEEVAELVSAYGDRVAVVELIAGLDVRLDRNRTEARLAAKKSKRDLDWSEANVREMEDRFRMATQPGLDAPGERLIARWPHLRLNNTHLTPGQAAAQIAGWLEALPAEVREG